jgi:hypothetical protein
MPESTLFPIFSSHALPEFYVNGVTIPQVNFDVGPSWSGLIPISGAPNETRKVVIGKLFQATSALPY